MNPTSDPAALLASLMGGQQQPNVPLMGSTLPLRESPNDDPDPRELLMMLLQLLQQGGMGGMGMQPPMDQGMSMMQPEAGAFQAGMPGALEY